MTDETKTEPETKVHVHEGAIVNDDGSVTVHSIATTVVEDLPDGLLPLDHDDVVAALKAPPAQLVMLPGGKTRPATADESVDLSAEG